MSKEKHFLKFQIFTEKEVEKTVESKDETGADIKITKKVRENVPVDFAIKRPSRRLLEEAAIEYSIKHGECIRRGMLTSNMLSNQYIKSGGVMPEELQKKYEDAVKKIGTLKSDIALLSVKGEKGPEDEQMVRDLIGEIETTVKFVSAFEQTYNKYFENTAENFAEEEKIKFFLVHMLQVKKGNDYVDYFVGDNYKAKKEDMFTKDDSEDEFYQKVFQRAASIVLYWNHGIINTTEDFERFNKGLAEGEELAKKKEAEKKAEIAA